VTRTIKRSKFGSTEDFLYYLYNTLGAHNLALAYSFKGKDGTIVFSKWIDYTQLMQLRPNQIVQPLRMTKKTFLKRVSHRTVLPYEILFDVDDYESPEWRNDLRFQSIKHKSQWVHACLTEVNANPTVYTTGSRGYHISVIASFLAELPVYMQSKFKLQLLKYYGCDLQKASKRCMIALEGVPHWKSGKIKKEVKW